MEDILLWIFDDLLHFCLVALFVCIIIIFSMRARHKEQAIILENNYKSTLKKHSDMYKNMYLTETQKTKDEMKRAQLEYEKKIAVLQQSYLNLDKSIQAVYDALPENKEHYVASLMSDYLTFCIFERELELSYSKKYHERQRAAKVKEIREEAKSIITGLKEAQYQLDYLLQTFPELNDVINYTSETAPSFEEMQAAHAMYNDDPVSGYISREEWDKLSTTERNQLALDRYLSRKKSNWEIGRDYELYVAHCYEKKGYIVDTFGSYMRLQDLGRDLIAIKDETVLVIQCKCWSAEKEIRENSICQLYGTVICYCIENGRKVDEVKPVFVTSTTLSEKAKEFADMLNVTVIENFPLREFPRIKCNVGYGDYGVTHIYHLPMDAQYDNVKISKPEECYCFSVKEAEEKGFRRAYRWHEDG